MYERMYRILDYVTIKINMWAVQVVSRFNLQNLHFYLFSAIYTTYYTENTFDHCPSHSSYNHNSIKRYVNY